MNSLEFSRSINVSPREWTLEIQQMQHLLLLISWMHSFQVLNLENNLPFLKLFAVLMLASEVLTVTTRYQ